MHTPYVGEDIGVMGEGEVEGSVGGHGSLTTTMRIRIGDIGVRFEEM